MKAASLTIGLIAGVAGIAISILFVVYGNVLLSQHQADGGYASEVGGIALLCSLGGVLGAAIALGRPRLGAVFMVAAAAGLVIVTAGFALISGPLFVVAALLALVAGSRSPTAA
jgi:hypothetical protein